MTEVGRIEKPSAASFREVRKLYCVPLLFHVGAAPEGYKEKYELYWEQVADHLRGLERAGKVRKVYHEGVFQAGEEGLKAIKQMNEKSYQLAKSKCDEGAELQALEDKEAFNEFTDWLMCLSVVGRSQKVASKVLEFFREASEKRDEHVVKHISETLKDGEAGMLIMSDEYRMRIQPKLPRDIQVFLISPPALHDIQKLLRENIRR